jgi:uncharacterized protein YraI
VNSFLAAPTHSRLLSIAWLRVSVAVFAVIATLAGISGTRSAFASTTVMPVIANNTAIVSNTGGDPIRIRSGPGTGFPRLAYAYEGQTVSVLDGPTSDAGGNHWFEVQAPAGTGWMAGAFLQGAGAPLTGTALITNTGGDPLRVRDAPNTAGQVLTLLSPGAQVTINSGPVTDSAGIAWYNVTATGVTGWSMAQYLSQPTSAPQEQVTPAPNPQAIPSPTPTQAPPSTTAPPQSSGTSGLDQYRLWMEEARTQYPYSESVDKMWSVMMCESGGNASAAGGGGYYRGLFQYAPGTWAGNWNPYRNNSIWDAKSQIFATARAWNIGMQHAWGCY